MTDEGTLSLALSGGGHRATAFGLGAMLAVADAGLNGRIVSISSVSGGSIANGIAMVGPDYRTSSSQEIAAHFRGALRGISARGVLLGGAPATRAYIRTLIGTGVIAALALVALLVTAILNWWTAVLIAAVVMLAAAVAFWVLFRRRSVRTERAIDAELLGGKEITLAVIGARDLGVHHVICTTELQAGHSFFFTSRGVYGYGFGGSTSPPGIPLATAVQASAAVPGAFAPRSISLRTLGLAGGGRILVNDGGVYDNMADEWEYGYSNRQRNFDGLGALQSGGARLLVVVNGSGGWNEMEEVKAGGLGEELAGLLRSQAVQYDVSTAHRRRALHSVFRAAETDGAGLDGVFVQITDSPYRVTEQFASRPEWEPDDRSKRADEARAFLDRQEGYDEATWRSWAAQNSAVKTTLAPLGPELTARLVEHGYVLTMINLYVLDGLGSLEDPLDRARFRELCT